MEMENYTIFKFVFFEIFKIRIIYFLNHLIP